MDISFLDRYILCGGDSSFGVRGGAKISDLPKNYQNFAKISSKQIHLIMSFAKIWPNIKSYNQVHKENVIAFWFF